jgi:hypothetical protein
MRPTASCSSSDPRPSAGAETIGASPGAGPPAARVDSADAPWWTGGVSPVSRRIDGATPVAGVDAHLTRRRHIDLGRVHTASCPVP